MERSGLGLKRLAWVMALCFISLPLVFLLSMLYQNSAFVITNGFTPEAVVLGEQAKNISRLSDSVKSSDKKPGGILASGFETVEQVKNISTFSNSEDSFDKKPSGILVSGFEAVEQPKNISTFSNFEESFDKKPSGILASGFDSESCRSRYESGLYRKASPHKLSDYLIFKLRKYENRHKRCGPGRKYYNQAVKALDSGQNNITTRCKYIVWLPSNGLGNRIMSMTSAFVYALLTDRVLLVHHGTDMDDLFCEPFPNTTWLLPKSFPLVHQFDNPQMRNTQSLGNILRNRNLTNTSASTPPAFLLLYLAYNYDDPDKVFYLDQNQNFLQKVPWLLLRSDQYFVPYLFLIRPFEKELNRLFPDKETVFHHLGRYLFNPSNQAWGLITRFYNAYLARSDQVIGLQIRLLNPESNPTHLVMNQIRSCTENEHLLPQLEDQQTSASAGSKTHKQKAILVASLHSIYYQNLKNMYWMKPTVNGDAIGVFQPSSEGYQHFGDNMHNIKAWAEMNILSLSDVLVTSSWSTFGYVAQGLGGLKPWILFMPDNQSIPDPPCQKVMSMEPCFHFPPSYDRKKNIIHDNVDLGRIVRHCEDVSWGVKLVNRVS